MGKHWTWKEYKKFLETEVKMYTEQRELAQHEALKTYYQGRIDASETALILLPKEDNQ